MVNRVVSTKLTEEEHTALLDACNNLGHTPSAFMKAVIMDRLKSAKQPDTLQEILTGLGADSSSADERPPASANE
ncbi:MAG: hypothetical protein E6K92_00785 [Thaumarchaeota archaeon]|nr:MAG: hypothetical protein E6K92_00785 [Nitrososphaerota archaeon]